MKKKFIITALICASSFGGPALAVDKYPEGYSFGSAHINPYLEQKVWVLQSLNGLDENVNPNSLKLVTTHNVKRANDLNLDTTTILDPFFVSCNKVRQAGKKSDFRPKFPRGFQGCDAETMGSNDMLTVRTRLAEVINSYKPELSKSAIDWESGDLIMLSEVGEELALFKLEAAE